MTDQRNPLRYRRATKSVGAKAVGALATGRSLADIGEQQGAVPALLEGLTRAVTHLADQEFEERQAEMMQRAKLDGSTAGSQAALSGRMVKLKAEGTAAAQAFNRSLVTSYLSDLDVSVDRKAQTILDETRDDPIAFQERFDALTEETMQQWRGSKYEGLVETGMARLKAGHMAKVRRSHLDKLRADANAKLIGTMEHRRAQALDSWRNGDPS